MRAFPVSRRVLIAVAALAIAGTTVSGMAGTASAAPAVTRPTTEMLVGIVTPLSSTTYKLPGQLVVQSSGKPISGAVVEVIRGETATGMRGTTNGSGDVSFTVTVAKGATADFRLKFPGNNSFVMSTSPNKIVP